MKILYSNYITQEATSSLCVAQRYLQVRAQIKIPCGTWGIDAYQLCNIWLPETPKTPRQSSTSVATQGMVTSG